ncbi:MAG TPA: hypothetical protein VMI54_03425 [Polyangiaceae bacterium]|nr:hypothetical protein [Polyangiaceae bacterium]
MLVAPSLASAAESLADWVKHRVDDGLVKPLARAESKRSRFSRERPPPAERRVRVLEASAATDKNGHTFVPFVVDVRYGLDWDENQIVGCAYRESGNLFVKAGNEFRPAAYLLGKRAEAVPGVCEAAPPPSRS